MLFILALAIGIIGGAIARQYAETEDTLVRVAAIVAGFIIGFAGTYIIVQHLTL